MSEETVVGTAEDRLKAAVEAEDQEYIDDFTAGVEASQQDEGLNGDAPQGMKDGYEMNESQKVTANRNRLIFSPHPIGGIMASMYGSDGTFNQCRLELSEASLATTHLTALLTMMIQSAYAAQAQAAQQANSGIIIPGR